jgi:hypothetical protein
MSKQIPRKCVAANDGKRRRPDCSSRYGS